MFNYLFSRKKKSKASATIAKERLLQVIVPQNSYTVDLGALEADLLKVVLKYYPEINSTQVKTEFGKQGSHSVLELNVILPDNKDDKSLSND